MFRFSSYDEVKDLQAVDCVGWIDIAEAVENGYVPASIDADEMLYNEIEDPASIMPNADDVFALYRQADYIKGFTPKTDGGNTTSQTEQG